jgi:hypothetical protein
LKVALAFGFEDKENPDEGFYNQAKRPGLIDAK